MIIEPTLSTWMHRALTRQFGTPTEQPSTLRNMPDVIIQQPDNRTDSEAIMQLLDRQHEYRRPITHDRGLEGQQVAIYDDQGRELSSMKRNHH